MMGKAAPGDEPRSTSSASKYNYLVGGYISRNDGAIKSATVNHRRNLGSRALSTALGNPNTQTTRQQETSKGMRLYV